MDDDFVATQRALESADRKLAATTISGEDVAQAFDALIEAWRSLRAAELAELCELVSQRADVRLASIETAGSQQNRMVAWASAFREHSPLGLAPLLADFEAAIRENAQPRFVFPRIDALSTLRDDPRIAPVILRALVVIEGGSKWQKILLRYFRGLEATGDPRTIAALERILAEGGKGLSSGLVGGLQTFAIQRGPETLNALRERFPQMPMLPASLEPLVTSLKNRIAALTIDRNDVASRRTEKAAALGDPESLLRDVYADPDDDAARMVLADALMERGDPRGELITLQMRRVAGESTPKTIAREKALLKANMRAWLGPLAAVVSLKSAVFERGFLTRCEATTTSMAMAELHFHHPEWATVRAVEFRGHALITPAMTGLREATRLDDVAIMKLRQMGGHPQLERMLVLSADDAELMAALGGSSLPKLQHLAFLAWSPSLRPPDIAWLWDPSLWGPALVSLAFPTNDFMHQWLRLFAQRPRLEEVRFHRFVGLNTTMNRLDDGVSVTIQHDPTNRPDASLYLVRALREGVDRLNGSNLVRTLRIETNGERFTEQQRAEIEACVAKLTGRRATFLPW